MVPPNFGLGRHLYGLAAILVAVCGVVWHEVSVWQIPLSKIAHPEIVAYCIALVQVAGGVAIQFSRSARAGAAALAMLYAIFALLWLPSWAHRPFVYDGVGNFFEQFSMAAGAAIVYGPKTARVGYYGFGVCLISFAVVQAIHLHETAALVPKWIPPGQMFWAVVTTAAFVAAALALLANRSALLVAQLTALMIGAFGVLIWIPAALAEPRSLGVWAELGETFVICGTAWIVADYVAGAPIRETSPTVRRRG